MKTQELENRLQDCARSYRSGLSLPPSLHSGIMARAYAEPSRPKRSLLREALVAAAFLLTAGLLAAGAAHLRSLHNNAPAKPKSVTRIIPWVNTPAGEIQPALPSEQQVSPLQAALMIKQTVTQLNPVLLPTKISAAATAVVSVQPDTFTVEYHPNKGASIVLAVLTPQLGLPAADLSQRRFRGVTATYALSDPQHPEYGQFLSWTEPGSSTGNAHGVPYFLKVGGLTEAQFWQVANSIAPVPALTSLARPCGAADVQAIFGGNTAGTGNIWGSIIASNRSATPCMLDGTPAMQFLDAGGRVLSISQTPGQFGGSGIMPALLDPNSPKPVPFTAVNGQAALTFEVAYCPGPLPPIESIRLILPDNGGTITFPAVASGPNNSVASERCDGMPAVHEVAVAPFVSTTTTESGQSVLVAHIAAPRTVLPGTALHYTVTLTNTSSAPYLLSPCPGYTEFLGQKLGYSRFLLNCGPVGPIAPGASVTFAMVLQVPAQTPAGQQPLEWVSDAGPVAETLVDVS